MNPASAPGGTPPGLNVGDSNGGKKRKLNQSYLGEVENADFVQGRHPGDHRPRAPTDNNCAFPHPSYPAAFAHMPAHRQVIAPHLRRPNSTPQATNSAPLALSQPQPRSRTQGHDISTSQNQPTFSHQMARSQPTFTHPTSQLYSRLPPNNNTTFPNHLPLSHPTYAPSPSSFGQSNNTRFPQNQSDFHFTPPLQPRSGQQNYNNTLRPGEQLPSFPPPTTSSFGQQNDNTRFLNEPASSFPSQVPFGLDPSQDNSFPQNQHAFTFPTAPPSSFSQMGNKSAPSSQIPFSYPTPQQPAGPGAIPQQQRGNRPPGPQIPSNTSSTQHQLLGARHPHELTGLPINTSGNELNPFVVDQHPLVQDDDPSALDNRPLEDSDDPFGFGELLNGADFSVHPNLLEEWDEDDLNVVLPDGGIAQEQHPDNQLADNDNPAGNIHATV